MLNYMYILTCMCTLVNVSGSPWASPDQEKLDEARDAEIYEAVVTSMNEWHRKHDRIHSRVKREEASVCYPRLGCFEASGPFGYLDMLPSSPEEINTKFLLYPGHSKRRSGNPPGEVPFYNLTDAFTWAKQGFNNTLPTKVMIHGFGSDCSHIWVYEMRSALLAVEEANVICVDWGNGALLPNYVKATANTRLVGKQLAMLLRGLVEEAKFSLRNMHLIGFSLGAHVAGFAGAELGNLSRITGLDPAGPLFESQDPRARLDQTDADFVDVIHSNGENLILGGLGSWQPMGHVDFYPNGGRMQKGCSNIFVGAVSDIIWSSAVEGRSLCNHRRAYKFFTDSVSPRCHFPAFPCDSYDDFLAGKCFPCSDERKCGNMGYYSDRSKGRGQLYLITRDEEPFCSHQYHIKIESTPSEVPIISYGKIQITLIGDSLLNETFTLTRKEDEEMKLGASVSRIIVPHPILLEPTKIQILYSAYSGWLTSGLLQWRIDKITLSDSFGRSSSVCKKNLILDSGVPVVLPLYPGECNLPKESDSAPAEDRLDEKSKNFTFASPPKSKFVPTPVIKMGSEVLTSEETREKNPLKDAFDIFNIPWNNDNNIVDTESEQSRAFNTRVVKMTNPSKNSTKQGEKGSEREVVEPILRPHSVKIGRSHDPKRQKVEITEPILGPTTSKNSVPNIISKITNNNKELVYNFYDVEKDSDWVPSVNPTLKSKEQKWKRQDSSKSFSINHDKEEEDTFNAIFRTVQILPQRLARMFEEAEKYARETILPFVSTYTPKFLSEFITPKDAVTPKYLPLKYEANTEQNTRTTAKLLRKEKQNTEKTRAFDPPPILDFDKEESTTQSLTTTQYSNIQKIGKKGEKVSLVFAETMETTTTLWEIPNFEETGRKLGTTAAPKEMVIQKTLTVPTENATKPDIKSSSMEDAETAKKGKGIYINLPVFDENYKEVKYIPLVRELNKPEKTR